jgi:STE24 endopeptidase
VNVLIATGASAAALYLEAAVAFKALRSRAERVERSTAPLPDRLHELQRTTAKATVGVVVITFLLISVPGSVAQHQQHRSHHLTPAELVVTVILVIVAAAVWLSATLAPLVAVRLAVRPSYARMRNVPRRVEGQRRLMALSMLIAVVFIGGLTALDHLTSARGGGHLISIVGGYAALLLLLQTLMPPLLIKAMRAEPVPAEMEARMEELADRMRVRVRAFVTYPGRNQRQANALQVGLLPRLRYIAISDYLVENLTAGEVDAVVAHELGHARGRHLLLKLYTVGAIWAVFQVGLVSLVSLEHVGNVTATALIVPLALAFPVGMFTIRGLVGVKLEERADDAAAEVVGTELIVAALDRIAELNDSKRDTGRAWALVTQHPGFDERLARLRATSTAQHRRGVGL